MRVWMWLALTASGCSCFEEKKTPVIEAPVMPRPVEVAAAPAAPKVVVAWQQVQLTPQRMELAAKIDFGPTGAPLTVQLELPPGVRVTRGRAFFTLEPTPAPKTHVESLSLAADALPVSDLLLVVTGPGVTVREPYRFGRPAPR